MLATTLTCPANSAKRGQQHPQETAVIHPCKL
jgi:hypothetical protein